VLSLKSSSSHVDSCFSTQQAPACTSAHLPELSLNKTVGLEPSCTTLRCFRPLIGQGGSQINPANVQCQQPAGAKCLVRL